MDAVMSLADILHRPMWTFYFEPVNVSASVCSMPSESLAENSASEITRFIPLGARAHTKA